MKKVSIIIPVYNSEQFLPLTIEKILDEIRSFIKYRWEILLIVDGSPDNVWSVCKQFSDANQSIKSINLLKNYGQHNAVLCGMKHADGDYIITMDDDLQNPPSEIIKLVAKLEEGHDLVFGRFPKKEHSYFRIMGSKIINYFNQVIFNKPKEIVLSNFRIFSKEVANTALEFKTNYPYIPGLLLMSAHSIANVATNHDKRTTGKSNYSLTKILKLVSNLLINYSSYPLKILTLIGAFVASFSFMIGLFVFFKTLISENAIPGWASLMVMLSFFNGVLISMLGVIGVYVSRTVNHLSQASPYQIKESINIENVK